jgi:hypothetical protein
MAKPIATRNHWSLRNHLRISRVFCSLGDRSFVTCMASSLPFSMPWTRSGKTAVISRRSSGVDSLTEVLIVVVGRDST